MFFWVLRTLLIKNIKLKLRAPRTLVLEFLIPLLFIALLASLKTITSIARVHSGWTRESVSSCPYPVPEDSANLTCTRSYGTYVSDVSAFDLLANNIRGRWTGHETAKLCLATSSGNTREVDALNQFIQWVEDVGPVEGTQSDFSNLTFTPGDGSVSAFESYVRSANYGNPEFTSESPECAMALVFDEMDFENAFFTYTLRLNSSSDGTTFSVPSTLSSPTDNTQQSLQWVTSSDNPTYIQGGFMSFQRVVDSWIISTIGNISAYDDIWQPSQATFVPFPVFSHTYDEFFFYVGEVLPLVFTLVFLYPVALIFEGLVRERETRVSEMLKIMGVSEFYIVTSWYIMYMMFFGILSLIITLCAKSMLPSTASTGSGSTLLWFLCFFFGISITAYSYAFSTFFWHAKTASYIGVMIYFMGFFIYYAVNSTDDESKPFIALLFPQVPFSLALQSIATLEANNVGLSSVTFGEFVSGFTVRHAMGNIIFDIFFWTVVGAYLSNVLPSEFGQRRSVIFFLKPSYWHSTLQLCCCRSRLKVPSGDKKVDVGPPKYPPEIMDSIEKRSSAGMNTPRIQIRELCKTFSTPSGPKKAVDHLSMDMYEGEILALLGHNGAGKTTTLQILSGMTPVTDGDAFINGASIVTNMDSVRQSLGFCPQHDVLYPTLTVREHLWFYGRIKGMSGQTLKDAVTDSITEVGLTEKANVKSSALSGGMKRKLSVAIALLGNSKVIFVDEPTSGVDPWSRRSIWQVLQNAREGRVIVLTTHFMDEADLLGDQIAIMAEGKLQCQGSSLFLKHRFGAGYLLTMIKKVEENPHQDAINVKQISSIIKKYVPSAVMSSNVGTEVAFQLPTASVSKFPALFKELEISKSLPIDQYGVSVTTLEEVFLQVARADDQRREFSESKARILSSTDIQVEKEAPEFKSDPLDDNGDEHDKASRLEQGETSTQLDEAPRPNALMHFKALFLKRIHYARRDYQACCCSMLMPIVLFAVGLLVLKYAPIGGDPPLYELSPKDWNTDLQSTAGLKAAAMPIIEFDENGTATTRVSEDDNFPAWGLEVNNLTRYPTHAIETIFERDYEDGIPASDTCSSEALDCSEDMPSELHGTGLLNLADQMINNPSTTRMGASLYTAAIVQPMRAVVDYSCLVASVDLGTESIITDYVSEVCTESGSPCAYVEFELEDQRICLPVGCYSNLMTSDTIDSAILTGSVYGIDISSLIGSDDMDTFLANSLLLTCEGELCNSGPASIFDTSVCRASATDYCIPDDLTAYKIDSSTYEIYEASGSEVDYCDSTRNGGSGSASSPTAAPTTSNLPDTGYCYSSGIGDVLAEAFIELLQMYLSSLSNETIASGLSTVDFSSLDGSTNSSDPVNVQCLNTSLPCSFVALDMSAANIPQVCIYDSCVEDREAAIAVVEESVPGFNDTLASGTRYTCNYTSTICDSTIDLVQLEAVAILDNSGAQLNETINSILDGSLTADNFTLADFNLTEVLQDNPEATAAILVAMANPTQETIEAALETILPDDVTTPDGFNATEFLNDPEVQALLTQSVQNIYNANNTVVQCTNSSDTCLLSQISFVGGTLCAPVGCRDDFSEITYAYIPILASESSFEDVAIFECNTTLCNDDCRSGGNCEADDLDALLYNATLDTFSNGTSTWCPPEPYRFGYTALINSTASHGAPILANAIHNALLRQKAKELGLPLTNSYIRTNTHPMPVTTSLQTLISGILAFTAAIFALIAFAFVPASVASYVVQEREDTANVKLSQIVSGAGVLPYWLSLYVFDMLNFLVPLAGALALIRAFDIDTYMENGVYVVVFLLLLGYGLAVIPFAYLTSNFFSTHTKALIMTLFINLLTGLVLMIASFVMDNLDNQPVQDANAKLKGLYRIFPGFCLGDALIQLSIIKVMSGFVGPTYQLPSPYDDDIAGASLRYLYIEALFFFIGVLVIEFLSAYPALRARLPTIPNVRLQAIIQRLRKAKSPYESEVVPSHSIYSSTDEDVIREASRVHDGGANGEAVIIKDLHKVYGSGKIAVRDITLGIPAGETFGLLGVNGAGKTTTLKMLTGELTSTSGSASIGGFPIATHPRQARRLIGYCPQFDALLDLLTVREHLELFGSIKGFRGKALEMNIQRLLRTLTLKPFENKLAGGLSGGTRRKLSLAIALIGAPRVIFLDEPTTGVDAISKRFIWDVLDDVRDGLLGHKSTLILTSHSMEEVEALSTRLGIMVGGRFRCLGSAQHLKARFGKGLLLEATLKIPSVEARGDLQIQYDFPDVITLEDITSGMLDPLGNEERVAMILGHSDEAWVLSHHLDEYGEVNSAALLEWWLIEEASSLVHDAIVKRFPGALLTERHELSIRYSLPERSIADTFDFIERNKDGLHIEEYAVSQVSLESIFNMFASQQDEERGVARGIQVAGIDSSQ